MAHHYSSFASLRRVGPQGVESGGRHGFSEESVPPRTYQDGEPDGARGGIWARPGVPLCALHNRYPSVSRRWLLRLVRVGLTGGVAHALLAACGERGPRPVPSEGTRPGREGNAPFVIRMTDQLRFEPATLVVPANATVCWQNTGGIAHTVTADPAQAASSAYVTLPRGAPPWDSGPIPAGMSWSYRFVTPGEYTYFCIPHQLAGMIGRITVRG